MSATTDIYVTASTSLILIRNVSTPTNIYLNTFNVPNFQISVRDTTGSATIQTSTVRLSTIGNARFIDGSSSYILNQPYGFVNVGFRNSSFWQVLHTSGQVPQTSAADVGKLNVSTSFVGLLSTFQKNVSSLLVENLTTTNAIVINSPFIITNLSAPGIVTVLSTFNVYGDVKIDQNLFISGATTFHSSLFVTNIQPISSITRVFSSVGVGGTLSVGGLLTIGSTLHTLSTNSIQTLQVQKSTTDITTNLTSSLEVQGVLSTLGALTVLNSFTTQKNIVIQQNVSSLGNAFSTDSFTVGRDVLVKDTFSTAFTTFYQNVFIASSLGVIGPIGLGPVGPGLSVKENFFVSSFSTLSLLNYSSFSTGLLFVRSTALFSSGLSTVNVEALNTMSVGRFFQTVATVSSLANTTVRDTVFVRGPSLFDYVNISSGVCTNQLVVAGSVSTVSSILFRENLSTLGYLLTTGVVNVKGNVGVSGNLFVQGNMTAVGNSEISSFFVNSFLLSNLFITTSSPFNAFTASTIFASTIQTTQFLINPTNPSYLTVGSTFTSSAQINTAIGENVRFSSVVTSNLFWGPSTFPDVRFSLDARSLFPKGLSAQTIKVSSLTADFISSAFIGNGIGLRNAMMPFASLSANIASAKDLSASTILTSSIYTSSFLNRSFTRATSSFQSPTLSIEGIGFPTRYDKNQILVLNSNLYVINRGLYIDTLRNRVGVNISTPQADMDISGGLYPAGGIYYSSINDMYVSTLSSPLNLSTVYTAYAWIRDTYQAPDPNGIEFVNYNVNSNFQLVEPFLLQARSSVGASYFGIFSYPSSIGLLKGMFINNNTRRVGVNIFEPSYEFSLTNNLNTSNAYISSVHAFGSVESDTLVSPSLYMNARPNLSINTLSTGVKKLYVNNDLLTILNGTTQRVGIKQPNPGGNVTLATLDITGSAYFSTLTLNGSLYTQNVCLGSILL